jgi:hypothetical protein
VGQFVTEDGDIGCGIPERFESWHLDVVAGRSVVCG